MNRLRSSQLLRHSSAVENQYRQQPLHWSGGSNGLDFASSRPRKRTAKSPSSLIIGQIGRCVGDIFQLVHFSATTNVAVSALTYGNWQSAASSWDMFRNEWFIKRGNLIPTDD